MRCDTVAIPNARWTELSALAVIGLQWYTFDVLFCRVDCAKLPRNQLCAYVRYVTALGIHGMPALVSPATGPEAGTERVPQLQADDRRACAEVLYRATVSLLVTFCDGDDAYQEVVRAQSLSILSKATTASSSAPNGAADKRVFGLIGVIASACPISGQAERNLMFVELVTLLTDTVQRCLSADLTTGADAMTEVTRAKLALQALVDLLSPSTSGDAAAVGLKARFLALGHSSETDGSNAPIAAIVAVCLR